MKLTKRITLMCRLLAVVMAVIGSMSLSAQTVPQITMFYPSASETPMVLKNDAKAYIYFSAKVSLAKAQLIKDNRVYGEVEYTAKSPATTLTMDPKNENNQAINTIGAGVFTISVYYLEYPNGDETAVYNDPANPLGTVNYEKPEPAPYIVSESGLPDNTMYSYYDSEDLNGVKIYTFSKPMRPDGITAHLEYGSGTVYRSTTVPSTLSEDGMSVSIDLRGKSYSPDVLAPGVTFTDDDGNTVPPPTTISLIVNGLTATDGSKLAYTAYSADGKYSAVVEGYIHHGLKYVNVGFPTPVLTGAEFYASTTPATRYQHIKADTDMMDLMISGMEYIASANVKFERGDVSATVTYTDVTKGENTYTVAVPESVRNAAGTLVVSLVNVVYTESDGADHEIAPLNFESVTPEVLTVAALDQCAVGELVVLNTVGLTVTLSNDYGYTFAQDDTAGMMVTTADYSKVFDEGTLVNGRLVGTWLGNGLFLIDAAASDYTIQTVDITTGVSVASMEDLLGGEYNNMLVTLNAGDFEIAYQDVYEYIVVNDAIAVVTDMAGDVVIPANIGSVTGVLFVADGGTMLIVRNDSDIRETSGINSVESVGVDSDVYDLRGIKVRKAGQQTTLPTGVYIIGGRKVAL